MRLTYLAHASLLIESGGVRLVTDPWLEGPTYLSAWWQFPEPALDARSLGPVDYVYLTHEHVDHFHVPTLLALPRTTKLLVGAYTSPRFAERLRDLGFATTELAHGDELALPGGLRLTSYQYRADDTALVIADESATVLDLNDCLLRDRSLAQVLDRHPRIDLLCASFANAEAYPIVYELDDPTERPDWDDAARFDGFLDKVRQIDPAAFVPFASMFCFLSEELFDLNARIVSPQGLIDRARAGEVKASALPMNPGDRWSPERGHELVSTVDWADKPRLLEAARRRHAPRIAELAAAEIVPGAAPSLSAAFAGFFTAFFARIPWPLRRRLELALRFDVEGPAAQTLWLRMQGGRLSLDPPASDDAFDARVRVRDWPLWRACTRAETWQSFGISCRFRVQLRPAAREREVMFWFLLYLDDMGWLEPAGFLRPRALGVLFRRRRELLEHLTGLVAGRFVESSLRGKFAAR